MEHHSVSYQRVQKSSEYQSINPIETIYLKHFDREIPLTKTYKTSNQLSQQLPYFITQFEDKHVNSGEKAHFEARIKPEYDPNLTIEWFFNNQKLIPSPKILTSNTLGLIELTILNVDISDAGIYLCKVSNQGGETVSAAALSVTSRREYSHSIKAEYNEHYGKEIKQHKLIEEKTSSHTIDEKSKLLLQQQLLESQKNLFRIEEKETRKPVFLSSMNDLALPEGSNAHFHCRLEPSNDHNLSIEWFFNGKPLVKSSRISSIFSNGYVALTIYYLRKEDQGIYTLKAYNLNGEAITQVNLEVILQKKHTFDYHSYQLNEIERQTYENINRLDQNLIDVNNTENDERNLKQNYDFDWQQKQNIEEISKYKKHEVIEVECKEKPKFITELYGKTELNEGQTAQFEAKLIPQSDSNLKVEWFKNGETLEYANRITTFFGFGYVSIRINHLTVLDSGQYTCVATNLNGSDSVTTNLVVKVKKNIENESQFEDGLKRIHQLERTTKHKREEYEEIEVDEKPKFLTELYGKTSLNEGQTAHIEAKLTPQSDPNLKVEWYKNGELLEHANRISTFFGFGYVSLEINFVTNLDEGQYTCVATNLVGTDSVTTNIYVNTKTSIENQTQYEDGLKRIQYLESTNKYKRSEFEESEINEKPKFITELHGKAQLYEGQNAHFESRLTPLSDPTMVIEWFKDGQPLEQANRISTFYNFGYIAIIIKDVRTTDSGIYTCIATNNYGQDRTDIKLLVVVKGPSIIQDTNFEDGLKKIKYLENSNKYKKEEVITDNIGQGPRFIKELTSLEVYEDTLVHFESRVEPYEDPDLICEWYKDGVQLNSANRIGLFFNFGYVGLDIKGARITDSGVYTCVARNKYGQAKTEAHLAVLVKGPNIIRDSNFEDGYKKIQQLEHKFNKKSDDLDESSVVTASQFPESLEKIQYLENHNKYKREEVTDDDYNQPPRFVKEIASLEVWEDTRVHFEGRVEPMADPNLFCEWYKDGVLLSSANRIGLFFNFGFVGLDIKESRVADSGVYTCVAKNKFGEAKSEANLIVKIKGPNIIRDTNFEDGLKKIQILEDSNKYQRREDEEVYLNEKPKFLTELHGKAEVYEGQTATFETKLHPISEPTMKVEWFKDDLPLEHANRISTFFNFGYVGIIIRDTRLSDAGIYKCVATNNYGQDKVKVELIVYVRGPNIQKESNYESSLHQIQHLEMRMNKKKESELNLEPEYVEPPKFLTQIESLVIEERGSAHFEARLTPTNDPHLKTEWFFNNKLLSASHRYRTFHNFGFVSLDIIEVTDLDEGEYVCRATNKYGMDVTKATIQCTAKKSVILDPQLPAELFGTNEKIKKIEEKFSVKKTVIDQENAHVEAPHFLTPLIHPPVVIEEEVACMTTDLVPVNDPELVITWFKDGEPLRNASRIKHTNNFGKITLEISPFYLPDSGTYTCKAQNKYGHDQVTTEIRCETRESIILHSQLPEGIQQTSINKIAKIEEIQQMKFHEAFTQEQQRLAQVPKFSIEQEEKVVDEDDFVRFESKLTPTHDQTMKIEWYHNSKPLVSSSRIKTFHDFNLVALEIRSITERDAGIYLCRAYNQYGEATYTTRLIIHTKKNVLIDSQLPAQFENSLKSINRFEQTTVRKSEFHIDQEMGLKPKFLTHIEESVEIVEGESFTFSCHLEPAEDPDMQIIWYKNGELLRTGTRIKQIKQFGTVILSFEWILEHDAGNYVCKAINKYGSDMTKSSIQIKTKKNIILDPQVPPSVNLDHIRRLENKKVLEKEIVEAPIYPPKFITQIQSIQNLKEGETAHFECHLMPTNDPQLQIQWFFNGKPLIYGHRFRTQNDFNFVSLDILDVYAEDSGEYCVKAINQAGEDVSTATLHVRVKPSLIYQSQLPNTTMKLGIQRLTELENKAPSVEADPDLMKKSPEPPKFVTEPESHEVYEGESVRFSARISANPKARVFWVINGKEIVNGSKYKLSYDGMYHLEILKSKIQDSGKIEIYGKNIAGECYRSTTLLVKPRNDDYRLVLKNSPRPWYDTKMKKYQVKRKEEEVKKCFDEKLTPGGTEIARWKTEQSNEDRVKVQEHIIDEQKIYSENILNQNKQQQETNQNKLTQDQVPKEKTFIEKSRDTLEKQPKMFSAETETGIHGHQIHELVQKQVQKQDVDNMQITRKLTLTEIREQERRRLNKDVYVRVGKNEKIIPPELTIKLEPIEIYEGDRAEFKCEFTGLPTPNVTWYRDNFLIQNSNDFQIETKDNKSTLIIRQAYLEDSSEISVKVENSGGCAKSTSNLIVSVPKDLGAAGKPPTFTKTIQDIKCNIGELSRFDAIVVGAKPIEVYWEKDGKILEPNPNYKLLNEGNQYTLLILETHDLNSGLYQLVARNQFGDCRCEAKVSLLKNNLKKKEVNRNSIEDKAPIIIEKLNSVNVKEGGMTTFKCKISNVKSDQVAWYKNKSFIKPSKFFRISNDRDLFVLTITEAYPEDMGVYDCVATNSAGSVTTSATLQLIDNNLGNQSNILQSESQVIHEPLKVNQKQKNIQHFKTHPKSLENTEYDQNYQQKVQYNQDQSNFQSFDQQQQVENKQENKNVENNQPPQIKPLVAQCAQVGSTVNFETTYSGFPLPKLTWLKDQQVLQKSIRLEMLQNENTCCLLIKNVTEEDSGMYTIIGENDSGQSKTTAQLLVVDDAESMNDTVVTTTTTNSSGDVNTSQTKLPKKGEIKKKSKKKK